MKKKIIEFLRDESGQTSTEYILLVAVVALIVFKFKGKILETLVEGDSSIIGSIFNSDKMTSLKNLE